MGRKLDKIAINNPKLDKRVKLTDEQRKEIFEIRERDGTSYGKLALQFRISKRMVIFICKPETLEANKEKRAERGGSKIYYDKEKNNLAQKAHREYKKSLIEKGLL